MKTTWMVLRYRGSSSADCRYHLSLTRYNSLKDVSLLNSLPARTPE